MAAWSAFCHGAMHALHTNYMRCRHSNQHISIYRTCCYFMLQYREYRVAMLLLRCCCCNNSAQTGFLDCSGAGAPRHDQRRSFYVYTVVDSRYLEMDVAREREGSLNGSEVEGGAMRNGMCRKILRSGAALEAIVRRGSARSVRRCTV